MSRRGALLFVAMAVIWGIPYLFIRLAVAPGQLTPASLVFGRSAVAAAILLPLAAARGELAFVGTRWRPLAAFAVIEMALPWLLISHAEQSLSSSLTGLLLAAVPLAATLIGLTGRDRERPAPANLAGLALGLAGVAAIVGLDLRAGSWIAFSEMGLVAVCYAVGPVILNRHLAGAPPVGVMAAAVAACALAYLPAFLVQHPTAMPALATWAAVVVLAIVCTAVAFIVFGALIAEVGPVRATVITYLNPAVAAVLGVLVLSEPLTAGMLAGFALVVAGSALATHRPRPAGAEPAVSTR